MAQPSNPGTAHDRLSGAGEGWVPGAGLFERITRRIVRKPLPLPLRAAWLALFAWIPLLALGLAHQAATPGSRVVLRILREPAVHVRFLVAVPLLVLGERVIPPTLARAAKHFVVAHVIDDCAYYREILERARNPRGRWLVDPIAFVVAEAIAYATRNSILRIEMIAWTHASGDVHQALTWPGLWYMFVGLPIFIFLSIRWLYRWGVWGLFLFRATRLDLKLYPTHPDRAGGLGFLAGSSSIFGLVIVAWSSVEASILATELARGVISATAAHRTIFAFTVGVLAIFTFPHCFFVPRLFWLRRRGAQEYGAFGQRIVASIHERWVEGDQSQRTIPVDEREAVKLEAGTLADFGTSFDVVRSTRVIALNPRALFSLLAACLLPMIAVAAVEIPVVELARLALHSLL